MVVRVVLSSVCVWLSIVVIVLFFGLFKLRIKLLPALGGPSLSLKGTNALQTADINDWVLFLEAGPSLTRLEWCSVVCRVKCSKA